MRLSLLSFLQHSPRLERLVLSERTAADTLHSLQTFTPCQLRSLEHDRCVRLSDEQESALHLPTLVLLPQLSEFFTCGGRIRIRSSGADQPRSCMRSCIRSRLGTNAGSAAGSPYSYRYQSRNLFKLLKIFYFNFMIHFFFKSNDA